jgi:hypothetical protein
MTETNKVNPLAGAAMAIVQRFGMGPAGAEPSAQDEPGRVHDEPAADAVSIEEQIKGVLGAQGSPGYLDREQEGDVGAARANPSDSALSDPATLGRVALTPTGPSSDAHLLVEAAARIGENRAKAAALVYVCPIIRS